MINANTKANYPGRPFLMNQFRMGVMDNASTRARMTGEIISRAACKASRKTPKLAKMTTIVINWDIRNLVFVMSSSPIRNPHH